MISSKHFKHKKKEQESREIQVQNNQLESIIYLLQNLQKDLDYIKGLEIKEMIDSEDKDQCKKYDSEEIQETCQTIKTNEKHQKKKIKKQMRHKKSFEKKEKIERKNK